MTATEGTVRNQSCGATVEHKLNEHLESQGFQKTAADPFALLRRSSTEYSIIVIYVNDVMIFCKTTNYIEDIKNKLESE